MQLTVRDASRLLNTLEETIYHWIQQGSLPAYRLQNRFRFNRAELLEWATSRKLQVSPDMFEPELEAATVAVPPLSDTLRRGGVFYRVRGEARTAILRAVVETMQVPDGVDRDFLLSVLLARAPMDATAAADGMAIPHVRHPLVVPVARPVTSLHFLERSVDFGAPDGKPVWVVFSLMSPTVRGHMRLLSQLAGALRDPDFRSVLDRRGPGEEILSQLRRIEARLAHPASPARGN